MRMLVNVDRRVSAGARLAPSAINAAFATLEEKGHRLWEADNATYWIQWTVKGKVKSLWSYDPELKEVVEVLQVKDKL